MQKLNPWTPTFFALLFSATAVFESITQGNWLYSFFFVNVPWMFMFVTFGLLQLQKENAELRARLDALDGKATTETMPGNRAVNPV
ncbi:hypothetical protein [uncultured Gimesia sp.]|jgi:hypothetical protein|uniref:hypothetical protein n=1 Tax=uncultured Gimesia sp. TaxID=1678688 RepID=UPI0026197CA8|nr:hypothetical protein [uncultured Gimesia sp.]